jgi:hypothetical protein
MGSLRELGYLIDVSRRIGYLDSTMATELTDKYNAAARTVARLIQFLEREPDSRSSSSPKSQDPSQDSLRSRYH